MKNKDIPGNKNLEILEEERRYLNNTREVETWRRSQAKETLCHSNSQNSTT